MTKKEILEKYPPSMENLLLILHDFQNNHPRNYLSEKDLALVAGYLNTPYSSIYGVASYYSMFSLEPRGRHIISICRSPVCHMAGVNDLLAELNKLLKIDVGETTADGLFTLAATECLGQCDGAPAMAVDKVIYGNLTADKIENILHEYKQKSSRAGSQKRR